MAPDGPNEPDPDDEEDEEQRRRRRRREQRRDDPAVDAADVAEAASGGCSAPVGCGRGGRGGRGGDGGGFGTGGSGRAGGGGGGCDGPCDFLLVRLSTVLLVAAPLLPDTGGGSLVSLLIGGYRRWLTRYTPRCPSTPSCSTYALAAVASLGPRRGLAATARRVHRCGR